MHPGSTVAVVTDNPGEPRQTRIILTSAAALVVIAVSLAVVDIVQTGRAESLRHASISANGVVAQGVVVARDDSPKRQTRLTIDYQVDGRALEGDIRCLDSGCEKNGTSVTLTADRRHPDQFVTADGRYALNYPSATTFLLAFAAILCGAVGLAGLGYLSATRQRPRPPHLPTSRPSVPVAGRRRRNKGTRRT